MVERYANPGIQKIALSLINYLYTYNLSDNESRRLFTLGKQNLTKCAKFRLNYKALILLTKLLKILNF